MPSTSYAAFLAAKKRRVEPEGRSVQSSELNPRLHPWQAEIVAWAVRVGRAAIWAHTGLGIELKPSYWRTAVDNLRRLEAELAEPALFDIEVSA